MNNKKMNIVLSGSGTLFYVFIGALDKLLKEKKTEDTQLTVTGTSGGSIVASLIACGYSMEEIKGIALQINLKELADWSYNPLYRFGLIEGKKLTEVFKKYLDYTFLEAYKKTGIPLKIITTNAIDGSPKIYSSFYTPQKKIYEVVRASMSIPLMFKYVTMDNSIFIDGGLTKNFAIDLFKEPNTYGLRLSSKPNMLDNIKEIDLDFRNPIHLIKLLNVNTWKDIFNNFKNYLIQIISIILWNLEQKHIEDVVYPSIINLKTNYNSLSFEHTKEDILQMYREGYESVNNYLYEQKGK